MLLFYSPFLKMCYYLTETPLTVRAFPKTLLMHLYIFFYTSSDIISVFSAAEWTSPDGVRRKFSRWCKLFPIGLKVTPWIRWVTDQTVQGGWRCGSHSDEGGREVDQPHWSPAKKGAPAPPEGSLQNSSSELSASSMAWSCRLVPGSPGCWGATTNLTWNLNPEHWTVTLDLEP